MLIRVVFVTLLELLASQDQTKLPPEAQRVVDKYDTSVEVAKKAYDAAITKAKEQASKDLRPIMQNETKKGNLDTAMAIKAKLEELKTAVGANSEDTAKWTTVEIDAKSDGVSIGKLWRGQVLRIQYVDGTWGYGGTMGDRQANPDVATVPSPSLRLGISESDEKPNIIPGETSVKAYETKIPNTGIYKLRIMDENRNDNLGKVKYRYTVN